jgi:pimeloyl-ACP methyl ester carboxylesterase
MSDTVVLVHGGLWDAMDAEHFWRTTGIAAGLTSYGLTVVAPDRPKQPSGWDVEVAALGGLLENDSGPVTLVGASKGCMVAVLLALRYPVDRLLLAWPATGGDAAVDARGRAGLLDRGCTAEVVDGLLAGETLRGVKDAELAEVGRIPVAVVPSVPENPSHQRKTVDSLLRLIPGSRELPGCPEPPVPGFAPYLDSLVGTIVEFMRGGRDGASGVHR